MTRQRDLEPAAERRAEDRGDHRFVALLDGRQHLGQRCALGLLAELADIRAGDEGLSLARQHDRLERGVAARAHEVFDQPVAHRATERIDRRAIDPNHRHVAARLERDHLFRRHFKFLRSPPKFRLLAHAVYTSPRPLRQRKPRVLDSHGLARS